MRRILLLLAATALVLAACGNDDDGQDDETPPEDAAGIETEGDEPADPTLSENRRIAVQSMLTLDDLGEEWDVSNLSSLAIEAALADVFPEYPECEALEQNLGGAGAQRALAHYESTDSTSLSVTVLVFGDEEDATTYFEASTDEGTEDCLLAVMTTVDGDPFVEVTTEPMDDLGDRGKTVTLEAEDGSQALIKFVQVDEGVAYVVANATFELDLDSELELVVERLQSGLDR